MSRKCKKKANKKSTKTQQKLNKKSTKSQQKVNIMSTKSQQKKQEQCLQKVTNPWSLTSNLQKLFSYGSTGHHVRSRSPANFQNPDSPETGRFPSQKPDF